MVTRSGIFAIQQTKLSSSAQKIVPKLSAKWVDFGGPLKSQDYGYSTRRYPSN